MTTTGNDAPNDAADIPRIVTGPWQADLVPLAKAEDEWRALAARSEAASPYQAYDWLRAHAEAMAARQESVALFLRDASGQAIAGLALAMETKRGLRVAEALGGTQANLQLPLAARDAPLSPADWHEAFRQAAFAAGIDLFLLRNVAMAGHAGAKILSQAGPAIPGERVHGIDLDADAEAVIRRILSKDSRKKLRQKAQKLAALGPVALMNGDTPEHITLILDAFFAQKAARFRELGIPDPFASLEVRDFLRRACTPLPGSVPAVTVLALQAGERIVAVLGGATDGHRFSGMFLSFDADPEVARHSPGEQLVLAAIQDACARGLSVFDLGAGEARYKTMFCEWQVPLVDLAIGISLKGRLAAALIRTGLRAKGRIKATPWLAGWARRMARAG